MEFVEVLERGMSTYCEAGVGLFSTQPLNTISNLLIVAAAFFVWRHLKIHGINNKILLSLPLLLLIMGVGSMLWHGMPNLLTSFADTLPLSVLVLAAFFFLLDKVLDERKLVWGILGLLALLEAPFIFGILPSFNGFLAYAIALAFGLFIAVGLARKYRKLLPHIILVAALFGAALFFRTIDHAVCPDFPFGTHFLWHTTNALMLYVLIMLLGAVEKQKAAW